MIDLVPCEFARVLPVAQGNDPVRDPGHFTEPVRNVEDAQTAGFEIGDHLEKRLRLMRREARGRLVHDEESRFERQRLGDLDQLLLAERQVLHRGIRREVRRQSIQQLLRVRPHLRLPHQPEAPRLAPEKDIARHVEVVRQVEFLVDQRDAERLRVADGSKVHHFAVKDQSA